MAEYIERDSAIEAIMSEPPDVHYPQWYAEKIKSIPAADVVEVVRRKDCVYYDFEKGCPFRESGYFCDGKPFPHENDFCSYSKRKGK